MTAIPRYLLKVNDGRGIIFKSDGQDLTDAEADWFRQVVTAALRTKHLMENAGVNLDAALAEPDVTEGFSPKMGTRIYVHPLVNQVKLIIKNNGWSLAKVSQMLGKGNAAVSTWFRGQATPSFKDIYSLFGMCGYKLMPVPIEMISEVQERINKTETRMQRENDRNQLG